MNDLFGNPVSAGYGQRGRPAFQVTDENRNKIKLLLAIGWSGQRIANGMDISLATLKRYFRAELKVREQMRDRLDARRFEVTAKLAFEGNVSAMKELGRMVERNDLMRAARQIETPVDQPDEKAEKLGKKQQVAKDALSAGMGTDWGNDLMFPGLKN